MIMKDRDKCNYFGKICKFFCPDDPFADDFDDDYDWLENKERRLKESVRDKLLSDEKMTFEEYTKLLEIVTDKFRECFNTRNTRYDIIFRERTLADRLNITTESKKTESEDKENER